jgi:DNA-directed RNA polymerase specialized sigma24 family protein
VSDTEFPEPETPGLIERLNRGDQTVFDPLLERHKDKLRAVAREHRLRYGMSEAECGDDDAVNAALAAFWQLSRSGKLGPIESREEYWSLICALVHRQVSLAWDRLWRKGRGGTEIPRNGPRRPAKPPGAVESTDPGIPRRRAFDEVDEHQLAIPSGEKSVDDADELERFVQSLPYPYLGHIVYAMREGYTDEQIAEQLGVHPRTIKRRLVRIRESMRKHGWMK